MSHDATVKSLNGKVVEQRNALGKRPRFYPVTNAKFQYDDHKFMNLNVESDPQNFAIALGFLLMRESYYTDACERLGIDAGDFKWDGYSIEEWQKDFKARTDIILWNARKKQLDAAEKQLETLLSDEGKTANALSDIEALLG